jgi:tetratricopeptide (TPR) repeat protein
MLTPLPVTNCWTSILTNLGAGLSDRFARTGREADLEEAIRVWREAVEATPPDSPGLPSILNNLGNGLSDWFARKGRQADLDEAIRAYEQAVEATPQDSPGLPTILNNLGVGLRDRFARMGREADLDEAIRVLAQAAATPPNSPDLPGRLNNLGTSLSERFVRTGREADLDEAIRFLEQAVEATLPASPDLPAYLNNLGLSLRNRFGRLGQEADRQEAIRVYHRACELGRLSHPQVVLDAARNWGRWAMEREQWGETAEAYGYGLATGQQLLARQLLREHKESWLRDLREMSGRAAYALAKVARYQDAAATMERGRARLLAETLQRRRRDLEQLPVRRSAAYRIRRDRGGVLERIRRWKPTASIRSISSSRSAG